MAQDVLHIIDNVSYSKEDKQRRGLLPPTTTDLELLTFLQAIRDADRIEALGQQGLERCEAFARARGKPVPDDVIQHCKDKLVRLYSEDFIVTRRGRELARPGHQVILDYINRYR